MSDTIYSYYTVGLNYDEAEELGYRHSHSRIGKKMEMPPTVTKGRVCLKIVRPPKDAQGPYNYQVSFSFCSPADNFNRSLARKIANKPDRFIEIKSGTPLKVTEVADRAVSLLHEPSEGYTWGTKDVQNIFSKLPSETSTNKGSKGINLPRWFLTAQRSNISHEYRYRKPKS